MALRHSIRRLAPLVVIIAATAVACSDAVSPRVRSVIVRMPQDSIIYGHTLSAIAVATGNEDVVAHADIGWTSSDTNVAVVGEDGAILATGPGLAYIRAEFEGRRDSLRVRVVLREPLPSLRFRVLSGGSLGICAQAESGEVYCSTGPSNEEEIEFERMPGGAGLVFSALFTTLHSQCGFATDSTYWCWGSNGHRHFGNPAMTAGFETTDNPVQGAEGRRFISLSVAGHSQACGANAADSVVYCVGHNDGNQLGRDNRPMEDGIVAPVSGSLKAVAVTVGNFHGCALDLQRKPHCWGGYGTTAGIGVPTPVATNVTFSSIEAGVNHVCGLDAAGTAYCWGGNPFGQVGPEGASITITTPQQITSDIPFSVVRPQFDSTCGIGTDQALRCWGAFAPRSLSERMGDRAHLPTVVARGVAFKDVASAQHYACGITTDGRMVCW
jgi:hypothetical protein